MHHAQSRVGGTVTPLGLGASLQHFSLAGDTSTSHPWSLQISILSSSKHHLLPVEDIGALGPQGIWGGALGILLETPL